LQIHIRQIIEEKTRERETGVHFVLEGNTLPPSDAIRWYHIVVGLFFPYIALPWGIINLVRGKKRSGAALTITSAIVLLIYVLAMAINN
jgi:hypothetical protein